ncbi:MAG: hypothetical protein ACQESD_00095 [Thermoplasmatota archaeon]
MGKTPVLIDTNIWSTFAKINDLDFLFDVIGRERLYLSASVLHELHTAEEIGYDFVKTIFGYVEKDRISTVSIDEEEIKDYLKLPDSFGKGERESIVVCENRGYIFVSNETRVKNYCERNEIKYLDLPTLLRRAWKKDFLSKGEVMKMVEKIEEKDNVVFKNKSTIFENSS